MSWAWRSIVAGLCGAIVHSLLMYLKARTGLLSSFQPYESLQIALGRFIGNEVRRADRTPCSAFRKAGHKLTYYAVHAMFASGQKAISADLFDHLIGAG